MSDMNKDAKDKLSPADFEQMAGRMYECVDIQSGIEQGHFKTLDDVLAFVKERSEAINRSLTESGAFDGVRRITEAEFKKAETDVSQHLFLAGLDPSTLTAQ
ncbi:hypothetical protein BDI4_1240022 [Burkholderia diffusa]|uniref:hypothetical protein n=1 Tax=Burkholderia diffusa TaxID=488732 RepID=UPI001CAD66F8|nr:hypothetical protein [Burkholderia diffusa]CAG9243180.1 hypothetical protein BDI4_1240022 [Burkholderia diffusa]